MEERNKKKELADELLFIELKNNITLEDFTLNRGLELPLLKSEFVTGVLERDWADDISLLSFLRAFALFAYVSPERVSGSEYEEMRKITEEYTDLLLQDLFTNELGEEIIQGILKGLHQLFPENGDVLCLIGGEEEKKYNREVFRYTPEENYRALKKITDIYEKVPKDSLQYPFALHRLSYLYAHTGQYFKAKLTEEEAIHKIENEEVREEGRAHLEELSDYATMEEAEMLLEQGYPREAWNVLDRISGEYPYPEKIDYYRGAILLEDHDPVGAEDYLREAVKKAPEEDVFREKFAYVLSLTRKYEEAAEEYGVLAAVHPERFEYQYNLGILLLQLNDRRGLEHLKKANEISPDPELEKYIKNIEKNS